MALKLWLPLNGSLENKGISDIIVTNTNGVIDNNGKIGKCYTFGTGTSYLTIPKEAMTGFSTECSVSFWLKIISWNTNYATFFQAGLGSTAWNNYIFGFLRNNANSTICFTISNGSTASNASYLTSTMELNRWYHVALTYSTGKCSIYLDGVLDHEYTTTIVPAFSSITTITTGICNNKGSYQTNCSMNDLRIYDHCLSAKEVKEIAQGLVLHYKLDSPLIKTSQNLVVVEDPFNGATCYNGATSKYGYGTNTDIYETFGTFQNRKCTKVYMGTNNLDAYPYVYFNAFSAAGSTIHTLSFDYFPSILDTIIPYSYNGTYNWDYKVNGISGTAQNASSITLPVIVGQWNHIEVTAVKTDTTNTSRGIGYIRIGSAKHTSNTNNYWLFANIQVEEGPCATAYLGVGGTREGYVTDSSGYGNDGIVKGPLTIITDAERYSISTVFNGTDTCIYRNDFNIGNIWSYSCWAYSDVSSRGWEAIMILNSSGGDADIQLGVYAHPTGNNIQSSANGQYDTSVPLTYGQWNHICATFDGTSLKTYVNGTLSKTKAITNSLLSKTNLTIGARSTNANGAGTSFSSAFLGKISDVRIYATVLSAEDILDLYHIPANIDNLGGMHGFEFVEDNNNSISKNGMVHNGNISQYSALSYLKYDPNIYFEPDGSAWVHIYHHNHPDLASFASTDTFSTSVKKDDNRWFNATEVCNQLNEWEFLVKYCYTEGGTIYKERWIQTKNPETAVFGDVDAADITRITGDGYKTGTWGGLYKKNGSAYWVMNNGNSGNWWGATGSFSIYQGGIPGYGGTVTTTGYNDLYVRIDNIDFSDLANAKITANNLYLATNFIEK